MQNILKKFLPLKLKQLIYTKLNRQDIILPEKKRIFIFLSADYGNIGDLAISAAQKRFISENFSEYDNFVVPISKTRLWIDSIVKQVSSNDIITIIGGGNMGSLYPDIEDLRQLVIKSFPCNKIICFPQTLDWDESNLSHETIKRIVDIYSNHKNIHIFARESITYLKLKEIFSSKMHINIGFVPDIVMSATAEKLGVQGQSMPQGILTCLRDDKECALTLEHYKLLDSVINLTGYNVTKTDTHAGGSQLSEEYCQKLLKEKIQQFSEARLVITDRLHGMILCLLSGTPCLVLPNSNHKIKQTYLDWLLDHPRIIFLDLKNFENISQSIEHLLSVPRGSLNESPVDLSQYNQLIKAFSEK